MYMTEILLQFKYFKNNKIFSLKKKENILVFLQKNNNFMYTLNYVY